MNKFRDLTISNLLILLIFAAAGFGQEFKRDFAVGKESRIEIDNQYGRISVETDENAEKAILKVSGVSEREVFAEFSGSRLRIKAEPETQNSRIDINLIVPERVRVKLSAGNGEIRVAGNYQTLQISTTTGTIAADLPLEDLKYNFVWTSSRPRFLSDVDLDEVREKAAGKFVVSGKIINGENAKKGLRRNARSEESNEGAKDLSTEIDFTTSRGIILLNVDPTSVPSDLGEKPLTKAAQAIIRSGDSILMEAIRRASPKHFGDYSRTLPPYRSAPVLSSKKPAVNGGNSATKRVLVQVTDSANRAISGLTKDDFILTERGEQREIVAVEPETTSFNLVLLVDVSGSVDNYVNFIRKAARNFVETVDREDKVAIVIFNDDIEVLSNFTKDKKVLSESLDTFDAGGGTAYYDALGYVLAETLRPLKGDRTGIIVLSDGEDTRSFLPFNALTGAIEESGALVYPLYVPNGLIAAAKNQDPNETIDPLRARYFGLSSKAEAEGEQLAKISGGVYYPIRQLDELQKAYNDIVVQLRTAYSITYRSTIPSAAGSASPFLKVRVKRDDSFVKLGSVIDVAKPKTDEDLSGGNETESFIVSGGPSEDFAARSDIDSGFQYQNASISKLFYLDDNRGFPEIAAQVDAIKYKSFLNDKLRTLKLDGFDVNRAPGAFLLENQAETLAVSRWISPKRTRSYPYERVYDTLAHTGKKAAVIPVIKDEGLGGDRDFLQWDTISLLSLLDVHVVFAYYNDAVKNTGKNDKITSQKFDQSYVTSRLSELFEFKGTAREWNEREVRNLKPVLEKARLAYREISKNTKTYLHDESALNELIKLAETPEMFIEFSRDRARTAQRRESASVQPKEALSTESKGSITITNSLFGKYFFTVDETRIEPDIVHLIEAKHSQRNNLPAENDIKDGLLKMMLYTNLHNVNVSGKPLGFKAAIRLTSARLKSSVSSDSSEIAFEKFCSENMLSLKEKLLLKDLFEEARVNNFTVIVEKGTTATR